MAESTATRVAQANQTNQIRQSVKLLANER